MSWASFSITGHYDLPSLRSRAAKLTNPDEIKPVTAALAFLEPLLAGPAR